MQTTRVIIIVIDACGVGELPDAAKYGDTGAATLPHVAEAVGGLKMPVCEKLGLGNIVTIDGVPPADQPTAAFGKMAEQSASKDSTSGHWEMAGVIVEKPFPVFPDGFPVDLVRKFEEAAGVKVIGNEAASGTEIIARLGEEHLKTKKIILYTSADSVFQLAAHEDLYPLERQYEICRIARDLLTADYAVGRVIARPFIGQPGSFTRTAGRRDFSLEPPKDTILDLLNAESRQVLAIGKINDLFVGRGISSYLKTADNTEVMDTVRQAVRVDFEHELIFANCVDFDQLWGHRNDERSFARDLERFDKQLGEILPLMRENDVLFITADHGCDPTIKTSTDHTREYVPLLVYGPSLRGGVDLGTRSTFADLAATAAELMGVQADFAGRSFAQDIANKPAGTA
ncbi:phosphopentomutase [candidate division GN15 bacterium]|nr:phosphopentomutase [candidate division GN15 bacterium]